MEAVQQTMSQMMDTFLARLDTIQQQLPSSPPSSPGGLATELATFKSFVLTTFRALQSQIALLARQVDDGEMRARRKILLFHGLPETAEDNTGEIVAKIIVDKMKLASFTADDVSRCHRMGRPTADRPRPVLVKLRDVALRDKIWMVKSSLKGSGITVSEFLTKTRHDLFLAAQQRFGVSKCWTREGNIFVLCPDGTRHRVSTIDDLAAIQMKEGPTTKAKNAPKATTGVSAEAVKSKAKRAPTKK